MTAPCDLNIISKDSNYNSNSNIILCPIHFLFRTFTNHMKWLVHFPFSSKLLKKNYSPYFALSFSIFSRSLRYSHLSNRFPQLFLSHSIHTHFRFHRIVLFCFVFFFCMLDVLPSRLKIIFISVETADALACVKYSEGNNRVNFNLKKSESEFSQ